MALWAHRAERARGRVNAGIMGTGVWRGDVGHAALAHPGGGGRGAQPGSKVSMTIMRPPQQGHGRAGAGGPSGSMWWVSMGSLFGR